MNATLAPATTTATVRLAVSLRTLKPGQHVYVPISIPTGVPSGYARQAQLEANLSSGFRSYDAQVAR